MNSRGTESNFFHFFKHKFLIFGNAVQQERPCYGGHGGQIAYGRSNGLVSTRGNLDKSVE